MVDWGQKRVGGITKGEEKILWGDRYDNYLICGSFPRLFFQHEVSYRPIIF